MPNKFEFAIANLREIAEAADDLLKELRFLYGTEHAKGLKVYKDLEEKAGELREAIEILMKQ